MKDYYCILGVSYQAESREIKAADRKLAKQYHPDVVGGDREKQKIMYEIQEAYQVIGDEEKRRAYDRQRAAGTGTGKGAFAWEGNRERKETKKSEEDGRGTPLSGEESFARFFGFRPGTGMETYRDRKAGQKKPEGPAKPEEMFAFFFGHR